MPNPFTSSRLANRIARVLDLDEDAKTRLHRVMRNMVMKAVVPVVVDEDNGRAPLTFDDRAAAVLLALHPLAELGVEISVLREIGEALQRRTSPAGAFVAPIDRALAAVREGKKAELSVALTRRGTDPVRIETRVRVEGEEANQIKADYDAMSLDVLLTATVALNPRFTPLMIED